MALRRRGAAKPPREGARGRDKGRDDRELGAFEVQLGLGNLLRHLIITMGTKTVPSSVFGNPGPDKLLGIFSGRQFL